MPNIALPQNLATLEQKPLRLQPAEVQVSSADILADAHDIKQTNFKKPNLTIQDLDELRLFQLAKRRDYEQQLNKNRLNYGQWMRYAKWEIDHNHDFKRARSIMERALEVNVQHVPFWVRYIELELLHKNVNHARNLLHRAVTTLPRTDKFWFMYVQTEETLGNFNGVRDVFEKWLRWKPSEVAWDSYILFEQRYGELDNVRAVFSRFVVEYPTAETWKRWATFEKELPVSDEAQVSRIRGIFETAVDTLLAQKTLGSDPAIPSLILGWIQWESSVGEIERSQAILGAALDKSSLSKSQKLEILDQSSSFQEAVDLLKPTDAASALRLKQKLKLEKQVTVNPRDYDSWWEYIRLQEAALGPKYALGLLLKAVTTHPEHEYKLIIWRRYIFLWIKLALYTEYVAKDIPAAREVWTNCILTIPHDKFTFAKIWTGLAEFELRHSQSMVRPRKVLGKSIGQCCQKRPKTKIFKYYIELEKRLGELDRVRRVYEKWLESCLVYDKQNGSSSSVNVLQEYIEFEQSLFESERCIALFDMGISKAFPSDKNLFDKYIDFLKEEFRYEKARDVFRSQLKGKASQWIKLALFESTILSPRQMEEFENADTDEVQFQVEDYHLQRTRAVFTEAYNHYKGVKDGVNATIIVEAWLEYEKTHGGPEQVKKVEAKLPRQITNRRTVDGVEEIYHEYEFPETAPNLSKFLAKAKQWAAETVSS